MPLECVEATRIGSLCDLEKHLPERLKQLPLMPFHLLPSNPGVDLLLDRLLHHLPRHDGHGWLVSHGCHRGLNPWNLQLGSHQPVSLGYVRLNHNLLLLKHVVHWVNLHENYVGESPHVVFVQRENWEFQKDFVNQEIVWRGGRVKVPVAT